MGRLLASQSCSGTLKERTWEVSAPEAPNQDAGGPRAHAGSSRVRAVARITSSLALPQEKLGTERSTSEPITSKPARWGWGRG